MLFVIKIIAISLFIILGCHYLYNHLTETVLKNNKCNKNMFEYHTAKYKDILDKIENATKNINSPSLHSGEFSIAYRSENVRRFSNLSTLRSDKFIFGFDRVSAKTVNSNEFEPFLNDEDKINMYNDLLKNI